jgi:hypothetical protein
MSMAFIKAYRKYLTGAAIAWAGCLVLFLLAYIMALRPQYDSRKRLEDALAEQKELHASAQEASQEKAKVQLSEQIERLRNRLKDFVIDFDNSANLTFDVGQIASQEKVSSFSVKSKENRGTSMVAIPDSNCITESHMDISFIAGFYQFATFVNALERHRPVLFVREFTLSRSNQKDSMYQATLDVAAFVRKQQEKATAGKPSEPALSAKI